MDQLAAEDPDRPPSAEQARAVEKKVDYLEHALNPDNVEQQTRLQAARDRWQAILDAPEDRRLERIEADLDGAAGCGERRSFRAVGNP